MKKKMNKAIAMVLTFSIICSLITIVYAGQAKNFQFQINSSDINDKKERVLQMKDGESIQAENIPNIAMDEGMGIKDFSEIHGAKENLSIHEDVTAQKMPSNVLSEQNYGVKAHSDSGVPLKSDRSDPDTPVSVIAGMEDEYAAKRTEKLQLLSDAYPNEYSVIKASIPNTNIHVNLLEFIDFWEIDNINGLVNTYLEKGFSALEEHVVEQRDYDKRVVK